MPRIRILGMMGLILAGGQTATWGQPAEVKPRASAPESKGVEKKRGMPADMMFQAVLARQARMRAIWRPADVRARAQVIEDSPEDERRDEQRVDPVPSEDRIIVVEADLNQLGFGAWTMLTDAALLDHLGKIIASRIEDADRKNRLSDPEREKLRLACRGDTRRVLDDLRTQRELFRDSPAVVMDKARFREFWGKTEVIRTPFASDAFGPESLFSKTLNKILADREASGAIRE